MNESQPAMNPEYAYQLKWYYWHRCSLLPVFKYRPGNKHNCADLSFHWLIFRAWTGMVPQLGFEIKIDQGDFCIRLHLPYLYAGMFIPWCPNYPHVLWRIPKRDYSERV